MSDREFGEGVFVPTFIIIIYLYMYVNKNQPLRSAFISKRLTRFKERNYLLNDIILPIKLMKINSALDY